jgi:hypothetical protein
MPRMALEISAPRGEAETQAFRTLASESLVFPLLPDVPWPVGEDLARQCVSRPM